jgi:hypothetical protein
MSQADWEPSKISLQEELRKLELTCKEISRLANQIIRFSANVTDRSISASLNDLKLNRETSRARASMLLNRLLATRYATDTIRNAQFNRFNEQLAQNDKEWNRQLGTVEAWLARCELLGSQSTAESTEAQIVLQERGSLLQSMGMIDHTIETAATANSMIREQNTTLTSWTHKLAVFTARIPFVNGILSRINKRQFQERIILALVIGVCISVFIWMRILK